MIQLSQKHRLMLGAFVFIALLVGIGLIVGAFFNACDNRKIERHETNVNNGEVKVEQGEKVVEEKKQESSEIKGELKVRREEVEKTNVEVTEKVQKRNEAAARRERVRRNKLRNVNGADLNRILNEAERER